MDDSLQLVTDRLMLREFVLDDWSSVLAYQSDPRYLRYYAWESRSEEDVIAFVQMFMDQQRERPRTKAQLAIIHANSGELIGSCGIRMASPNALEANIGYELAPEYWGCGYASEAAGAILNYGFGELGLHRIHAECIVENRASARVLEKLGMRQKGRLRDKQQFKGRYWDVLVYSMLRSEWCEPKA